MSSRVILQEHIGYAQNGKDAALSPPTGKQLQVYGIEAMNRSGGAIDVGILKKLNADDWMIYSIVAASTPVASDITAAVQAATATGIFTLTNNDGFMIGSKNRFNLIGLTISTGASGGSPVYAYKYYNGSTMATLTTIATATFSSTGTQLILFNAPS